MAIPRAVLLVVLTMPLALASPVVDQGVLPQTGAPVLPQLRCEIVYTDPGSQECDVFGEVRNANELRITMATSGQHVTAFAFDRIDASTVRQLAVADCSSSCTVTFAHTSTQHAELYIFSTSSARTGVSVALDESVA